MIYSTALFLVLLNCTTNVQSAEVSNTPRSLSFSENFKGITAAAGSLNPFSKTKTEVKPASSSPTITAKLSDEFKGITEAASGLNPYSKTVPKISFVLKPSTVSAENELISDPECKELAQFDSFTGAILRKSADDKSAKFLRCKTLQNHLKKLRPFHLFGVKHEEKIQDHDYSHILSELAKRSLRGTVQIDLHRNYERCIDNINTHVKELKLDGFKFANETEALLKLDGCKDDHDLKEEISKMTAAITTFENSGYPVTLPKYRQVMEQIMAQSPTNKTKLELLALKITDAEAKEAQNNLTAFFKDLKAIEAVSNNEGFKNANEAAQKIIEDHNK